MLFSCAECNLQKYMEGESPSWTKKNVLNWVSQMRALSDALRQIHNLGPSKLQPDRINQTSRAPQHGSSESGFHHDLKPSNILVFINQDNGDLRLSISDFGSARIKKIQSGSHQHSPFTQNLSPGDAAYGAPDAYIEGKTSRPYDLWSMGCIFLELLTWIVGLEERNVSTFANLRMEEAPNPQGNQDQAFWYLSESGNVQLKECVTQQLEILKANCRVGVFPQLVRIVGKLLNIRTDDRPDASQLHNDLDAIMLQLAEDLRDENFYLEKKPTEFRTLVAAPPSSVSSVADPDDLRARRLSIDRRQFPARFG